MAASGSRYAALTWLFLEAGRLAGLRLGEWPDACWHPEDEATDGTPRAGALRLVHNAKATNGRAHGPYRTLHLDNLPPDEIATIARMLRAAHDQGAGWAHAYAQCRKLLFRIARCCWSSRDRYPTLYSGRHQFAADAKASGCTVIEVAALMGHRNDRVAQVHYGRRRVGRTGGFQVRADPDDVARVAAAQGLNADPAPAPQSGSRPSSGPSMG